MGLPLLPLEKYPKMDFTAWSYVYFNRFVVLPFLSFIIVKIVLNSSAVVWDMEQMSLMNTLLGFVLVFSLSDLTYYTGHRIVHKVPFLYKNVHKHHHKESHPRRGEGGIPTPATASCTRSPSSTRRGRGPCARCGGR